MIPCFREKELPFHQRLCMNVLRCGPVPRHLAFIMDGNRRYARKTRVGKAEGHSKGFERLAECLQWCRELGVEEVTVYAFSIENFKRGEEEVSTLMNLAKEKFELLLEEQDKIMKEGVRVRVIGNLSLLPEDVQKVISKAVLLTKDNTRSTLNIAFSYTSRDEIVHGVQTIVDGVNEGRIDVDDIDEDLIGSCLYSRSNPDVLIRTSGEVRLSDFLLWQIRDAEIYFADVLWPEFNIWHLLYCVFKYQRSYAYMRKFGNNSRKLYNQRVESFLKYIEEKEVARFMAFAQS